MGSVTMTIDDRKLRQIIQTLPDRASQALAMITEELTGDIVVSFGTSPSAPGQPPGVDTGALRASMRWEPEGKLTTVIMDGVEYGIYLEGGTERMAARPFMLPAFENYRRNKLASAIQAFGLIE